MKLWEVLKALEENPKRKFKAKRMGNYEALARIDEDEYVYFEMFNGGIRVPSSQGDGGFNGNISLFMDWQEVKEAVTWQEALEATMNDRKVTFFLEGFTYGFKKDSEISPEQIAKATWYIEE